MTRPRTELIAVLFGVGAMIAVVALDVLTSRADVSVGLLATGPLVAAVLARPLVTAVLGAGVLLLATGLAALAGVLGTLEFGLDFAFVLAACGVAVWLTRQRQQTRRSLDTMTTIAEAAQKAIIPPVSGTVGGARFAARYESATVDALVGGDFYEVVPTPYGVRAVIGDVCGKGLGAVRLSAKAVGSFATAAQTEADLPAVVKAMEASLAPHLSDEEFVTAALVEFDPPEHVTVVNCGHHPPCRLTSASFDLLTGAAESLPLGFDDAPAAQRFSLPAGSRLLLYTDGLVEARDRRGVMLPLERACRETLGAATSLEHGADRLLTWLHRHARGTLEDDVAILVAEPQAG